MNIWFLIYTIILVIATSIIMKNKQEKNESTLPQLVAFLILFIIVYLAVRKGI